MIPPEKSAAVILGLNQTFGVTKFEDILDLTERPGSNRAFRIVVRGSAHLLRINTRPGDMARHFTCMQTAADAGLAPRVWYANTGNRISITDFVEAVPLPAPGARSRSGGPPGENRLRQGSLGATLAKPAAARQAPAH
jgi:hypothetical protein